MKQLLLKLFLPFILLATFFGCATAPAVQETPVADNPAVITDIKLQGDNLVIACSRNFVYTMYSANDPYKITIEIPDVKLGSFKDKIVFDNATVAEIVPQQIDSPHTAVKLNLTLRTPATAVPLYKDNSLTLMMKHEEPVAITEAKAKPEDTGVPSSGPAVEDPDSSKDADAAQEMKAEKAPEPKPIGKPADANASPLPKATKITRIQFKKADGRVTVVITGNGTMTPNVFPLDSRIVVDIPSVSLKASIPAGAIPPLKAVRVGKHNDRVRLVLDLREKAKYDVTSTGSSIEISLGTKEPASAQQIAGKTPAHEYKENEPASEPGQQESRSKTEQNAEASRPKTITSIPEAEKMGRYSGKKISLDFQDADIGPIFRLLADVNGYNLVLDPSVKGRITIKLMNVPWDQALNIVLNTFNLSKQIEGNILWIAPTSAFAKILEEKTKEKEAAEKAEPLTQEVIRVNYATSGDLSSAITQGKLLSTRGSVTVDGRMNTLIVKDTRQSIEKIKELVTIMDVSKPQVMIEAKLVQVSTDYSESLGIQWGGFFSTQVNSDHNLSGSFSVNTPTTPAGPAIPNPGGAINLTVGHASSVNVNLSLSALESLGKSKTLSNPKVLTMDNEAATIQQGRTFYIATVSQAGTQTQQQQATLSLNVTPKIAPDGYIQLKVVATDNSLEAALLGGSPVVDTKSLTTQALVKNGETLVLGGIYTTDETTTDTEVPLLGKIPGLGWLFKTRTRSGPNVKELLIFITPTIMAQAR